MADTLKTSPARRRARDKWNAKQAQLGVRVKPEIKAQFLEHCQSHNESLAAFIVRAGLNQIQEDTKSKSLDLEKLLSE
ncbi:MAG: hypothetical protein LUH57_07365 [Ruminococcus sp.]|nr:hypothetical protein [Ruminococcus sp.]